MKRMVFSLLIALGLLLPSMVHADPKADAVKWVNYGNGQVKAKQFDAAITSFNNAIKLDKTSADAYQGVAYSYYYKGDKAKYASYMQYANYYKKAAGAAPAATGGAAAFIAKGNQYMQAKQYNYAAYYFNQAVKAEPNNAQAWQNLGSAYYYQNQKPYALQCWKKSLALSPNTQLQAYVNSMEGQSGAAPAAKEEGPKGEWVPYVMGAIVVVLGAFMLFAF
jgi:tetratricopeptide (TPR) repeat protein